MQLLASWRDSLKVVYPLNNLKLFVFATLRALQMAVPSFGALLVGALVLDRLTAYVFGLLGNVFLDQFVSVWVRFFAFTLTYFVVRPSVDIKNIGYWFCHRKHLITVFLVSVCIIGFVAFISSSYFMSRSLHFYEKAFFAFLILLSAILALPLTLFFFFDSRGSVPDFWYAFLRSVRMAVYNLPMWILLSFTGLSLLLQNNISGESFLWKVVALGAWLVIQLIIACLWSVFYTRRLHEQFELYFPAKNK